MLIQHVDGLVQVFDCFGIVAEIDAAEGGLVVEVGDQFQVIFDLAFIVEAVLVAFQRFPIVLKLKQRIPLCIESDQCVLF